MLLFVYGTLKSDHRNNHYLEDQVLVGEVETKPIYRLFENGSFPMMVEDGEDGYAVSGELWEIDEDILDELDFHEVFYERKLIEIKDYEDEEVHAYIYLFDLDDCLECYGAWG